jgi:hypothetical protein
LSPRLQLLTSKLAEIEKKYGLADKGKVREEAIFDMYKQHINQLRTTVRQHMPRSRTPVLGAVPCGTSSAGRGGQGGDCTLFVGAAAAGDGWSAFWAIAAADAGCFDHPPALSATKHLDHPPLHLSLPPLQVLDDMNKARTEDLSEITPNLSGLKPKLV